MYPFINRIVASCFDCLRALLGPAECLHEPSCGNYAREQLKIEPLHRALWKITKRLWTCSPFTYRPPNE